MTGFMICKLINDVLLRKNSAAGTACSTNGSDEMIKQFFSNKYEEKRPLGDN
jgi:hypothetical protein